MSVQTKSSPRLNDTGDRDDLSHITCWCSKNKKALCGVIIDGHKCPDDGACGCVMCIVCVDLDSQGCPDCGM